jgi:hypothetical protein
VDRGLLVIEFHTDGCLLNFTAQDHTGFVEAFYRIEEDRANNLINIRVPIWSDPPIWKFEISWALIVSR